MWFPQFGFLEETGVGKRHPPSDLPQNSNTRAAAWTGGPLPPPAQTVGQKDGTNLSAETLPPYKSHCRDFPLEVIY